jgi:colanic acid/amylovoran/stewartan biosynthesis glycosyltransferase WcaL/AmsK/CpsK
MIVPTLPKVSESFILNQIAALIRLHANVTVFALEKSRESIRHEIFQEIENNVRIHYQERVPLERRKKYMLGLGFLIQELARGNLAVIRALNFCSFGRAALNFSLLNLVRTNQVSNEFDIIHCHFGPMARLMEMIAAVLSLRGKIVTTFHGYDLNVIGRSDRGRCYRRLFRNGASFTVNSEFARRRLVCLGCPEDRIEKLPAGLPLVDFPAPVRRSPSDGKTIVSIGRLTEVKGVEYALQVVSRLKDQQKIHYKIIGDGQDLPKLKHLVTELGLEGVVSFLGTCSQGKVRSVLSKADLLLYTGVVASDGAEETQGLAIQEAQAAGVPVVAWDVGGVSEGLLDGETGFLIGCRDIQHTVRQIELLLKDNDLRERMGHQARQFARQNYDSLKLGEKLLRLYKKVAATRPETLGQA